MYSWCVGLLLFLFSNCFSFLCFTTSSVQFCSSPSTRRTKTSRRHPFVWRRPTHFGHSFSLWAPFVCFSSSHSSSSFSSTPSSLVIWWPILAPHPTIAFKYAALHSHIILCRLFYSLQLWFQIFFWDLIGWPGSDVGVGSGWARRRQS